MATATLDGNTTKPIYRTIKFPLKKLFSPERVRIIQRAVEDTHRVATLALDFTKLYVLHQYHQGQPLPELDKNWYENVFRVVSVKRANGGPPMTANADLNATLLDFHGDHFLPLSPEHNTRVVVSQLSYILKPLAESFQVVQRNNIVRNYTHYVRRYLNVYLRCQL